MVNKNSENGVFFAIFFIFLKKLGEFLKKWRIIKLGGPFYGENTI